MSVAEKATAIQLQTGTHYNIRCYDTRLRVIAGTCFINGYKLSISSKAVTLCSLNSHSRISVNTGNFPPLPTAELNTCLQTAGVSWGEDVLTDVGAIVIVEPSENTSTDLLRSTYKRLWDSDTEDTETVVKEDYFELRQGLAEAVAISSDWSTPVQALLSDTFCRVAVCGPQNSGKSTLARYTVNTLLSKFSTVLFLESDIGQSELTPPGLVTLSVVSQPLVNPPYSNTPHFVTKLDTSDNNLTSESFCIGLVSPAQVMKEYLEKLFVLIETAKKLNRKNVPLVVNFMGWTKGFGVGLHADILRKLEPTNVLNLQTNSPKDLPPIESVLQTAGIMGDELIPALKNMPNVCDIPGHILPKNTSLTFQAFELRHMALLNYFAPIYQSNSIAAPYKVSWADVSVIMHEEVEESLVSYTLNCSVVALLSGPIGGMSGYTGDIKLVKEEEEHLSTMKCLGLGIIRAVDVTEKVFYLNTPIEVQALEQVFFFKHTSLPVPHVQSGSLPMPYLSNLAASEIMGTGSRSQRANLKRRYQAVAQN